MKVNHTICHDPVGCSMNVWEPPTVIQTSIFLGQQTPRQSQSQSHFTNDSQSVRLSWCRAPSGAHDQIFIFLESYSPVHMGRPL
jgi:hypothetical protein